MALDTEYLVPSWWLCLEKYRWGSVAQASISQGRYEIKTFTLLSLIRTVLCLHLKLGVLIFLFLPLGLQTEVMLPHITDSNPLEL